MPVLLGVSCRSALEYKRRSRVDAAAGGRMSLEEGCGSRRGSDGLSINIS